MTWPKYNIINQNNNKLKRFFSVWMSFLIDMTLHTLDQSDIAEMTWPKEKRKIRNAKVKLNINININ